MLTSPTSSPFAFIQPFIRDFEPGSHHNSRERNVENEGHRGKNDHSLHNSNKQQASLLEDVYEPANKNSLKGLKTVDSILAMKSVESRISQSAEITIKTKEGDEVTIFFDQSASKSRNIFHMEQGGDRITAFAESESLDANFAFTIEGNINEDEQKALRNLIKKMDKVSNEFFNGDVKSAFKHAQRVGFDTSQIASFSMDLNMEKSVQAVVAYQQTSIPDQNISKDMLMRANDFFANAKELMSDTRSALDSLASPRQSYTGMFGKIAELHNADQEDQHLFNDIIEQIGGGVFAKKNE